MHGILNDPYINAEVTRLLSNVVQSDQVRSSSILLVNNLLAAERKHSNIISSYFSVLENPPLTQRSTGRQNFAGSILGPRLNGPSHGPVSTGFGPWIPAFRYFCNALKAFKNLLENYYMMN